MDCSIEDVGKLLEAKGTKKATTLRKLIHIFIKDNYPELSLKDIGNLITLDNMADTSEAIAKAISEV